jgi:hypothetical protein
MEWPDAERAWNAIEWTLAHDPLIGLALLEGGTVRAFIYRGARSIGQPDIEVIYETTSHEIIVHSAEFSEAEAGQAGHA